MASGCADWSFSSVQYDESGSPVGPVELTEESGGPVVVELGLAGADSVLSHPLKVIATHAATSVTVPAVVHLMRSSLWLNIVSTSLPFGVEMSDGVPASVRRDVTAYAYPRLTSILLLSQGPPDAAPVSGQPDICVWVTR